MKYETIHNLIISKIGFGTAQLGNPSLFSRSKIDYLGMVRSALEIGYRHIDTAERYAYGKAEKIIGQAIRDIPREKLFITSKVLPKPWSYSKVMRDCEGSLQRLDTDYLDLYLVHYPNPFASMKQTFRALNQLVRQGRVRHIGVSNFNLKQLKNAQALSESPILTNQVAYNLFFRYYAQNGVLEYCQKNDILLTAYMPVKINRKGISANSVIDSIAETHACTPFQVALAWLVMQPRVITIPQSYNPQHQRENFEAADITLTDDEMSQLNQLA